MKLRSEEIKSLHTEVWTYRIFFEITSIFLIGIIFACDYSRLSTTGLILSVVGIGIAIDLVASSINIQIQNSIRQITMNSWQDTLTNRIATRDAIKVFQETNEIKFDFSAATDEATEDISSYMKASTFSDKLDTSPFIKIIISVFITFGVISFRIGLGLLASRFVTQLI